MQARLVICVAVLAGSGVLLLSACKPAAVPPPDAQELPLELAIKPLTPEWLPIGLDTRFAYELVYEADGAARLITPLPPDPCNGRVYDFMPRRGFQAQSLQAGAWSQPETLFQSADRQVQGHNSAFSSCVDRQGRLHLAWLERREFLGIGFIIVDGESAPKPWHAVFENGRWSTPRQLTPPGRVAYRSISLTAAPDGAVHMACGLALLGYFERGPRQIEHRTFENDRWSKPERFPARERGLWVEDPSVAVDANGDVHCVYTQFRQEAVARAFRILHHVRRNNVWSRPREVGSAADEGIVGNDRRGRVYCFWTEEDAPRPTRAFIQVWDGRRRSAPTELDYPALIYPAFVQTPDGGIALRGTVDQRLRVQRFAVEELRPGTSLPEPSPPQPR